LVFAWRACRAVKSNAIVVAKDGATVGVGMGQVNRVDAARLAASGVLAGRATAPSLPLASAWCWSAAVAAAPSNMMRGSRAKACARGRRMDDEPCLP